MIRHIALRGIVALALGLFLSAAAHAQLFRTYIAPDGNDGNPCTLAAPCRLLPAALAAVIDGGEIWMLGSANYNTSPVSIAKSVTILAVPGALGSVVAIGGNAINIATAGVKVSLRNLVIVPFIGGGGTNGINMTAGTSLTVENCLIANLPGTGIVADGVMNVLVTDSTVRGNGGNGLLVQNGARATVTRTTVSGNSASSIYVRGNTASTITTADIADSTMSSNSFGVYAYSTNAGAVVKVSVRDSRAVGNTNEGITAESSGGSVAVSASNNIVSNNGGGIVSVAGGARVWASGNTVSGNGVGLLNFAGGLFESASDNAVRNNSVQTSGTITPVAKL